MRLVLLIFVCAFVAAEYPLSSGGCQCKGNCRVGTLIPPTYICDVVNTYCNDKTSDNCPISSGLPVSGFTGFDDIFTKFNDPTNANTLTQMQGWTDGAIQNIPIGDIQNYANLFDPSVLSKLTPGQLANAHEGAWNKINMTSLLTWSKSDINAIPVDTLNGMNMSQISDMSGGVVNNLDLTQLKGLAPDTIGNLDLSSAPVDGFMNELNWTQMREVHSATTQGWTPADWHSLDDAVVQHLRNEQIASINPAALAGDFRNQIQHFQANQLDALTTAQITAAIGTMNAKQIPFLNVAHLGKLATDVVGTLSPKQLAQLPVDALDRWNNTQWGALTFDNIVTGMEAGQLSEISGTVTQQWTPAQWGRFSPNQLLMFTEAQISSSQLGQMGTDIVGKLNKGEFPCGTPAQPSCTDLATTFTDKAAKDGKVIDAINVMNEKEEVIVELKKSIKDAESGVQDDATVQMIAEKKALLATAETEKAAKEAELEGLGYSTPGGGANTAHKPASVVAMAVVSLSLLLQ